MTHRIINRRRIALLLLTLWCGGAAAAQGPQVPACGTRVVEKDTKIDSRLFRKGTYRIHAMGISCEKVMGKHGLFEQFLSQDEGTPLPKPWRSLSEAVGAPKFAAGPGVGFRVQWVSAETNGPKE